MNLPTRENCYWGPATELWRLSDGVQPTTRKRPLIGGAQSSGNAIVACSPSFANQAPTGSSQFSGPRHTVPTPATTLPGTEKCLFNASASSSPDGFSSFAALRKGGSFSLICPASPASAFRLAAPTHSHCRRLRLYRPSRAPSPPSPWAFLPYPATGFSGSSRERSVAIVESGNCFFLFPFVYVCRSRRRDQEGTWPTARHPIGRYLFLISQPAPRRCATSLEDSG